MPIVLRCTCGCSRKIMKRKDGLYLVDRLLEFEEKITHIDAWGFINGRWTVRQDITEKLQEMISSSQKGSAV